MFSFSRITLTIAAVTFSIGALDYLRGNRWGLGKKIAEGFQTFTPLFLTMSGFIVLSPAIARVIAPLLSPLFSRIGVDPGVFAGMILACDNGAYPLAKNLCLTPEGAEFGGMLLGSVLGANIISIPIVLQLLNQQDREIYFQGLVFGIVTIPVGLLAGGLAAGFSFLFILRQLPPLVLLSIVLTISFLAKPRMVVRLLAGFARSMEILSVAGLTLAVFLELSGLSIPGIVSIREAISVVGSIVIILPGVYVFIEILARLLKRLLPAAAGRLHVNETSAIGFLTTTANVVPTLAIMDKMDARGKFLNCAFLASGAYVFGDHFAFCGSVAPELLFPLVVTKLTAGCTAVIAALAYLQVMKRNV